MELTPMCLRLESPDGCLEEYRICEGEVEVRQLEHPLEEERGWHQLTPGELTAHVNRIHHRSSMAHVQIGLATAPPGLRR